MYIYNNIRDELKSNPVCFIYKINQNNDFVLINKANSKRESKEILKNVSINKDKYFFIIIKLTFHRGPNDSSSKMSFLQPGKVKANLYTYKFINNVLTNIADIKPYSYMSGPIWFSKAFLEKYNWSYKYLDNIIKKVIDQKVKLSLISATLYEVNIK
jgi:hypothetical protein